MDGCSRGNLSVDSAIKIGSLYFLPLLLNGGFLLGKSRVFSVNKVEQAVCEFAAVN